jgi:hypothetical protein
MHTQNTTDRVKDLAHHVQVVNTDNEATGRGIPNNWAILLMRTSNHGVQLLVLDGLGEDRRATNQRLLLRMSVCA